MFAHHCLFECWVVSRWCHVNMFVRKIWNSTMWFHVHTAHLENPSSILMYPPLPHGSCLRVAYASLLLHCYWTCTGTTLDKIRILHLYGIKPCAFLKCFWSCECVLIQGRARIVNALVLHKQSDIECIWNQALSIMDFRLWVLSELLCLASTLV